MNSARHSCFSLCLPSSRRWRVSVPCCWNPAVYRLFRWFGANYRGSRGGLRREPRSPIESGVY